MTCFVLKTSLANPFATKSFHQTFRAFLQTVRQVFPNCSFPFAKIHNLKSYLNSFIEVYDVASVTITSGDSYYLRSYYRSPKIFSTWKVATESPHAYMKIDPKIQHHSRQPLAEEVSSCGKVNAPSSHALWLIGHWVQCIALILWWSRPIKDWKSLKR